MQRDYAAVVNAAIELDAVAPTSADRGEIEARYNGAVRDFVDVLLTERRDARWAIEIVRHEVDEIAAVSDEVMSPVFDRVRYDLIKRIEDEAGITPAQQRARTRLVGVAGVLLVLLAAGSYMSVRHYSAIAITYPIETKTGLQQRANALAKVFRHGDLAGNERGRGGIFGKILFWPIEPTERERAAASEFASFVLYGATRLAEANAACRLPQTAGTTLSDEEVELLRDVTAHIRNKATEWRDPPPMTLLDPIRAKYEC